MNEKLRKYVEECLSDELNIVQRSARVGYLTELNNFEKTIIYAYTEDHYESLNQKLRNGNPISEFGVYLYDALGKLENYTSLCYRSIRCTEKQLQVYYTAFSKNEVIIEKSFLSCSKSKQISLYFSKSPLFRIVSKTGKEIEKISKHNIDDGQNEQEVLFRCNTTFRVLAIEGQFTTNNIVITLEEV